MINRTGVFIFLTFFIGGSLLICWSIQQSNGWFGTSSPKLYVQKEPSFLKIKKFGVSKSLISQKNVIFNCDIKKSYIPFPINEIKPSIKEYLSKISGKMTEGSSEQDLLIFKGEEGILNYCDYSLTIKDCFFNIRTNPRNQGSGEEESASPTTISSKGGMKILTLSLLKTKK